MFNREKNVMVFIFLIIVFPFLQSCEDSSVIPPGYTILENVKPSKLNIKNLEIVSFLNSDETSINGKVIRDRAIERNANFCLEDAKYLLEHQSEIPLEFRGKYIVFTATLFRDPSGYIHMAYIDFRGGRWDLYFHWIDGGWEGRYRLVRSK